MDDQEQLLKSTATIVDNIVRVGVEINRNTHLRKLNQQEPLGKVIEEICIAFNMLDHEKYGLQFDNHATLLYSYITEENRHQIKDGSVCKLVYSPEMLVKTILAKMVSPGAEENLWSLQKILCFIKDKAFVEKFVDGKGVTILVTLLQGNALSHEATGYAFKCAAELLIQGFVPIESIRDRILDKVIHFILNQQEGSARTQESCLSIAHTLMQKHASTFPEIYKTISIEKVIPHLSNSNFWVQQTALGLINSIFDVANTLQRKLLIKAYAKQIREVVYKTIITCHKIIPEEMARNLALFQSRFISRLRRKAESPVDMEDNLVKKRIKALARLSLDEEEGDAEKLAKRRNTFVETTLTLLSDYVIPPPFESTEVPPSILVLDCMTHFTRTYHKNYTKAVLEHSMKTAGSAEYPFVQLCSQLVNLLTDALGITSSADMEADPTYHPVLFTCDKAFEELFCASIMVFSKTSKEMRAKSEDFQKVMNVVKKKVQVALSKKPLLLKDYEAKFYTLSYNDISLVWQEELQVKERADLREKKSLLQLKEEVKPDFIELIRKHRLYALTKGAHFPKFPQRGASKVKNGFWFVRYIPSQQIFEFRDDEEKINSFRLELCKIKNIVIGQNCPHVKMRGQKLKPENAFSLILTDEEPSSVNLAASTERQLHHVLDGFRMLLGHMMTSPTFDEDLQALTDMYVRLELLDAHGIEIPGGDPPPIPADPPNYDFCL